MPRLKVSSKVKSPSISQDESGATTAAPTSELLAKIPKKFEEVNMKFEKLSNKLDDMVKATTRLPISVVRDCSIRLSCHVLP